VIQTARRPPFLPAAPRLRSVASVLISEVEPDVRRLLVVMVERIGHTAAVLEPNVVAPPRADILLVDPRSRTGLEHARLVRAFSPELPVVCLSTLPEYADFLGRGPTLYLPKPFTLEQLHAALATALERAVSKPAAAA
jgi:DNA-binding response OmpR family regulator